jgi:hypothetical protein
MNTDNSVRTQDYIPEIDWPDVSVMLDGFGQPSLPATGHLAGMTLDIDYDDGSTIRHTFHSTTRLTLKVTAGRPAGREGTYTYRAVEAREGIFFIDVLTGEGVDARDISMVLNLHDGQVTTADSRIVASGAGDGRTTTEFLNGRVAGSGAIASRRRTDALVGKRIYYRYSPTERYEHIYLNKGTFMWHCIQGGEKGLADVDEARTYELGEELFIFFWTEGVMPVESFLIIDLAQQRSIGRMFCWQNSTSEVVHVPFDSKFTVLNDTTYPND